jgi:Holliday junction DNA helicase RuvA
MLAYISGKILVKRENYIIVVVNNIGYKIFVAPKLISDLGSEAELYLYQQVKEDGTALYGFKTIEELEFFELLLTVSGIGPKSALAILSVASVEELKSAIALGNHDILTKVSGVGAKTAERLVMELKNKVDYLAPAVGSSSQVRGEELEALAALGYSLAQAREALGRVGPDITDSGERLKAALKYLGR